MDYKNTLMWKEISEAGEALENFLSVNADTINGLTAAVEKKDVKNICLAGRGTSDHALIYFKYVAEILSEYTAGYVAPSVVTIYDGNVNFGGNLVIGCSQSGYAADVIAVIEKAKSQGAVTLAVTNDTQSPLAKCAEFHLYLNAGKEVSVAATKTFTVQLYAFLILACALGKRGDLIGKYSSLYKRIPFYAEQADAFTDKAALDLKDMKDGFSLARGITYSIAFESALKLQETCYIRMRGYSMSDFYHGPMAMVGEGTYLLVFAPAFSGSNEALKANHFADQKKFLEKMLSLGADITLVTDNAMFDEYKEKVHVYKFAPVGDEFECMFAFALFAQMLACKISCETGNNPDNPKALKKVTITK